MAEPAVARMTIDEFLAWDPGDDRRYELVDGRPVAMAPPAAAHRILASRLGRRIAEALDARPPCNVQPEAGIRIPSKRFDGYCADLAVTCRPHRRGQQAIEEPILVVEILSPVTEAFDRKAKLPDYRTIESVQEVALVDSETAYAELHRRTADGHWLTEIVRGREGRLVLSSVGLELAMAALYDGLEIDERTPPPADQAL
jgi:Uma2 family endonuclease